MEDRKKKSKYKRRQSYQRVKLGKGGTFERVGRCSASSAAVAIGNVVGRSGAGGVLACHTYKMFIHIFIYIKVFLSQPFSILQPAIFAHFLSIPPQTSLLLSPIYFRFKKWEVGASLVAQAFEAPCS